MAVGGPRHRLPEACPNAPSPLCNTEPFQTFPLKCSGTPQRQIRDSRSSSRALHGNPRLLPLNCRHVLQVHLCCADQVCFYPHLSHRSVESGVGEKQWTVLAAHSPLPASGGRDGADPAKKRRERLQMV